MTTSDLKTPQQHSAPASDTFAAGGEIYRRLELRRPSPVRGMAALLAAIAVAASVGVVALESLGGPGAVLTPSAPIRPPIAASTPPASLPNTAVAGGHRRVPARARPVRIAQVVSATR
jgi:hypothetical protein